MSYGVPHSLLNSNADGDLLALPPKKTFRVELLFPELPRAHRQVVISHLPASGIKLAAIKAISDAMERDEHICGRRPRRMILIVEGNSWDFDADGQPIKPTPVEYQERKIDPILTRLLRAWVHAALTTRENRVLLAVLLETQGATKPMPLPVLTLARATLLAKYNVSRTIRRLERRHMLVVDRSQRPNKIALQRDSKLWQDTAANGKD